MYMSWGEGTVSESLNMESSLRTVSLPSISIYWTMLYEEKNTKAKQFAQLEKSISGIQIHGPENVAWLHLIHSLSKYLLNIFYE